MKSALSKLSTLFKGFQFGMILQFAIGPVCLFIFSLASGQGFFSAVYAVLAVAFVDWIYILMALFGMVSFIQKENNKKLFTCLGAIILFVYGIQSIIGVLGWNLLPSLKLFNHPNAQGPFWQGFILTAANPLTILFWAGVLSAKIVENNLSKYQSFIFGFGCILATLFFLLIISIIGSFTMYFLPNNVIKTLNVLVGLVLIYFSLKMLVKKNR